MQLCSTLKVSCTYLKAIYLRFTFIYPLENDPIIGGGVTESLISSRRRAKFNVINSKWNFFHSRKAKFCSTVKVACANIKAIYLVFYIQTSIKNSPDHCGCVSETPVRIKQVSKVQFK